MTLFGGSLLQSLLRNRQLIIEMAKRDLKGAGKGAVLGHLWLVLNPLIQTAFYVFLVSVVFGARIQGSTGRFDYALYVLSGMVPWLLITRSLQDAPSLIRERMDLVKQVIYPIETLPLTTLLVSSIGSLVALCLFVALALSTGQASLSLLLLPLPIVLLLLFLLGTAWIFSIAGVVLKDLRDVVAVVLGLLVFFSPVVLHPSMVGERLWGMVMLNPLAHVVVCFRDVLQGSLHPESWWIFSGMALLAFAAGGWVINRTKVLINEYI